MWLRKCGGVVGFPECGGIAGRRVCRVVVVVVVVVVGGGVMAVGSFFEVFGGLVVKLLQGFDDSAWMRDLLSLHFGQTACV